MNPDLLHIRGRWMTMTTATRCVHHASLADACDACGLTGRLEDFTDAQLLAECDRRRMFAPVPVAIAALRSEAGLTAPKAIEEGLAAAKQAGVELRAEIEAGALAPEKPPERPAKKGRK